MTRAEMKARNEEFHEKLRALILEYPDVIGPRECPDDEDHDCDESPPDTNSLLTSYIISVQYDHLLQQAGFTDYLGSPTASMPQMLGLSLMTYKQIEALI